MLLRRHLLPALIHPMIASCPVRAFSRGTILARKYLFITMLQLIYCTIHFLQQRFNLTLKCIVFPNLKKKHVARRIKKKNLGKCMFSLILDLYNAFKC